MTKKRTYSFWTNCLCTFACACLFLATPMAQLQAQADMPPNALPGKCYAKCLIPAQYETVTDQILVKEAQTRLEIVPATYESVNEQILVKEAYQVLSIEPAKFSTVTEEVKVKDASSRLVYTPPVFSTVTEQVLIEPATTKWTKGRADRYCLSANPDDCKVWCLKETPARYKTVSRQVLTQPADVREVPISAQYKTVTKVVVQMPSQTKERTVPAEYRTINKQRMVSAATTKAIEIPAEYSTMTSKRLIHMGDFTDWVEVLCEQKIVAASISQIQQALKDRGYYTGGIDGIMGTQSKAALLQFQKDNQLPQNNLNQLSLDALGLNL